MWQGRPGANQQRAEAYEAAYAQGQRDLIASCGEPVAWRAEFPGGCFISVEREEAEANRNMHRPDYFDVPAIPLYRLPEGVQK